jgi:hypothetical protein
MSPLLPSAHPVAAAAQTPPRRNFLRILLTLAAGLPVRLSLAAPPADKTMVRVRPGALVPYLDTLIPADSTPSASQLGTDQVIIALARRNEGIARLLDRGCAWLDQQAAERGAADFADLPQAGRDALIVLAEQSPAGSVPQAFFAFTQQQVFNHYYAQPAAWQGLGFDGPPQPRGFPDFAQPPGAAGL